MTILTIVGVWILVSFPLAVLIGRILARSSNDAP